MPWIHETATTYGVRACWSQHPWEAGVPWSKHGRVVHVRLIYAIRTDREPIGGYMTEGQWGMPWIYETATTDGVPAD